MHNLGLLGMYFDAVVVEVGTFLLSFKWLWPYCVKTILTCLYSVQKVLLFPVRKILFFLSRASTCLKALDFWCYYETSNWFYNFSYHQSVLQCNRSVSSFWFSKENNDVRCFWATHVSSGYLWRFFLRYSKNLLYITDTEPSLEGWKC